MQLDTYMKVHNLDDEAMAEKVRKYVPSCDRSTISRLRRSKQWLSSGLALGLKLATGGDVTANDFVPETVGPA